MYQARNRELTRKRNREAGRYRLSGFTQEEVDALLVEQDYLCAICGNPLVKDFDSSSPIVTLAHQADHDHKTGQKRGLLCSSCNGGLGFFRDNPTLLRLAAFYLESYK